MPIFTYQCAACGHRFDELQKLGAEPLSLCPDCGDEALKKQLSAPRFHLKGGGWRNSEEPKPKKKPKYVHTFDSAEPHAEHHSHDHSHSHGHDHAHGHDHSHDHGGHGHGHDHGRNDGKGDGKSD